jgi:hypothetical protein
MAGVEPAMDIDQNGGVSMILIVDTDKRDRELLADGLRRLGAQVSCSRSVDDVAAVQHDVLIINRLGGKNTQALLSKGHDGTVVITTAWSGGSHALLNGDNWEKEEAAAVIARGWHIEFKFDVNAIAAHCGL